MKRITILEFPSNLGLIEPAPGKEPGVKKLPGWLKQHGFHERIKHEEVINLPSPPYTMNIDKESGVRNAEAIAKYAVKQANILKKVIAESRFPLVIGGDCSILIGNMLALKETGNYGLFFLDGHTDFIWPELSGTAGAAGMDLAIAAGHGHEKLTNINRQNPYVKEENIWCVGNREYHKGYLKPILDSRVTYIDLKSLEENGVSAYVNDFLQMIKAKKLDGFWLHIDVDVIDSKLMPAVDSPDPGGISYNDFNTILGLLLSSDLIAGLEITILDPDLDETGEYTKRFIENFCETFTSSFQIASS